MVSFKLETDAGILLAKAAKSLRLYHQVMTSSSPLAV